MSTLEQRQRYRENYDNGIKVHENGECTVIPLDKDLIDLRCGAQTRKGKPCKQKYLYINGRCKYHGGLSTGPITDAGKKKVAMNLPCVK